MKIKYYIIGVIIIIIDQIVKQLMIDKYVTIIHRILSITYTQNFGGAFGIGTTSIVTVLSILVIIGIIFFALREKDNTITFATCILIISGSISNLIDRLVRGYVIDYINIEFLKFPCFNISDICITIGIIFLIINLYINGINKSIKKDWIYYKDMI